MKVTEISNMFWVLEVLHNLKKDLPYIFQASFKLGKPLRITHS